VGLGVFQVVYADQVVATLPDSARGLSGSLTLVTRTVGIVGAAMVWLWLMERLQSRALANGVSNLEAIWASTMGLLPWAAGLALALLLLGVWRRTNRWH
jgi:preprotein translocase subunit SecY